MVSQSSVSGQDIVIPISESEYQELSKPWRASLICKVSGKSVSREFLKAHLAKTWKLSVDQDLIALGRGFYVVDCKTLENRTSILTSGPWFLQGAHIWTQCWTPGFRPSDAKCNKGVVWVNLPELPLEFYKQSILVKLGNAMG